MFFSFLTWSTFKNFKFFCTPSMHAHIRTRKQTKGSEKDEFKGEQPMRVELSSTAQLLTLREEKTGYNTTPSEWHNRSSSNQAAKPARGKEVTIAKTLYCKL